MDKEIKIRGAELALKEAIFKLRGSVHPKGCEEGKQGDKIDGIALSTRISEHIDAINVALEYWEKALRHYNAVAFRQAEKEGIKFP